MTNAPIRILGVDPGLNITGYGVLEVVGRQLQLVEAGVIRGRSRSLESRLREIHTGVAEVLDASDGIQVSFFEVTIAASFLARHRATLLPGS